ncbi:MAG: replication-associated recombination protein A [Candidatus Omnitrophica bacterium]|nr:replication-associated recombination protein A [Candidatus Omnitrophota bacterium]
MRPQSLKEVLGQDHLLAPGKLLPRTIQSDRWMSLIFYGPPGSGKTTLAKVISLETKSHFMAINAVTSNVSELRKVIDETLVLKRKKNLRTLLFIDEIHRFNKSQQDVLMPYMEQGDFTLIGATTHNPYFVLNAPLISRSTILALKPIPEEDLFHLLQRALTDVSRGLGDLKISSSEPVLRWIAKHSAGDARKALNTLEIGAMTTPPDPDGIIVFDLQVAQESSQKQMVRYDHDEDYHYDTISAFIKSMRASDTDAAIYWLAKMIYAGEDPRYIIRRMLIFASEDIGNADPQALILTAATLQALECVGLPEARIILSQTVAYLSLAPKSTASYLAISKALEDIEQGKVLEVPSHLRDAHYSAAKNLD